MSTGLKNKKFHAFFWSFIEKVGLQGIQFIVSIVLARLLLPEQYGLIGMLVIFLAVAHSFLDSGFGSALIQKQDANHIDECSIFYFNIAIGFVAASVLCLAASKIAQFYNEPQLKSLTIFLSLNIIINSFGLIHVTLLKKCLDFKTQAKISVLSVIISGPVGIFLAYNGYGVWSLAVQQFCSNAVRVFLLWILCTWRPSMTFRFSALRQMFGYGSRLFASGLLDRIFHNIYSLVIGKLFSAVSLGHYTRAFSLQQMPADVLNDIVGRVAFPLFSSMQHETVLLRSEFKKIFVTLAYLTFPIFIALACVAEPLVIVLLTDKWLPCVVFLQLLSLLGLMYPLHAIHLNLLLALGRSDLFFRLEILKKILIIVAIAITWSFGIEAMIVGQLVLTVIAYFLNCYFTNKLIYYTLSEQMKDIIMPFIFSLIMGGVIVGVNLFLIDNFLFLLAIQIITGIIAYLILSYFFKPLGYKVLISVMHQHIFCK